MAKFTKYIAICLVIYSTGSKAISQHAGSEIYSGILYQVLSLQFNKADSLIHEYSGDIEFGLDLAYLGNYVDFLDALITGDLPGYERYLLEASSRLDSINANFGHLPERMRVISAIHLQSSFLNAYHGDQIKAARNFYVAKRYFRQAESVMPMDPFNDKIGGLIFLVAGSAPAEYNWLMKIFGIRGDVQMGLERLVKYHDASTGTDRLESCLILLYARQMTGIRKVGKEPVHACGGDSLTLHRYFQAYHALKSGQSQEVIALLGTWQQDPGERVFTYLDLLLGEAKLNGLEPDAGVQLQRFLERVEGDHFVKTAWHKLEWHHYLNGDSAAFQAARDAVLLKGNMVLDSDKQAFREAGEITPPNPVLLRSRLYFDGGYCLQARNVLLEIIPGYLESQRDSLEYTYRLARISECLGERDASIAGYHDVIRKAQGLTWYYPSNTALHLGMVYEEMGDTVNAMESYQTCLKLNHSAYKNSIGNKAKQGIERLK